jgi:hypothetical protein
MKPKDRAMLASYARSAGAAALALYMTGNHDLKALGNAAIAGAIPPLMRWLNPNDRSFGRGQE